MKCPFCGSVKNKVTDSRGHCCANAVRRRRECLGCGQRFTTYETVELPIQVLKRDGVYEDFKQSKLIKGLESACHHSKIGREQLLDIANTITHDVLQLQEREVTTTKIGEMVMEHLAKMDRVAYIRFACVYRRFKEIDEIIEEIQMINV